MTYLTLPQIKKHLNIDDYYEGDDVYLTSLGDVCEQIVAEHIETPLATIVEERGALPAPLIHAMLLLLANFYMNRESVSYGQAYQIPVSCSNAFDYLLHPYINYSNSNR